MRLTLGKKLRMRKKSCERNDCGIKGCAFSQNSQSFVPQVILLYGEKLSRGETFAFSRFLVIFAKLNPLNKQRMNSTTHEFNNDVSDVLHPLSSNQ